MSSVRLEDNLPPDDIDDLIAPVCELADMDTTEEAPDLYSHSDPLLDDLIKAARRLRDREGFLSVDL